MIRLTDEDVLRVRKNFEEYIKLYGHLYSEETMEYIIDSFLDESFDMDMYADILHQVYSLTGAYDNIENFYDCCIEDMKEIYDIENGHLLDVGCGIMPAFAKRVSDRQVNGSVTGMDPSVIVTELGKVKVFKENFTMQTDVSKYDLVYGILPCDATLTMIKRANECDKDLYIQLCGCTHFEFSNPFMVQPLGMWYDYVQSVMESTIPANRKYEMYLPSYMEYPVLRTKKK